MSWSYKITILYLGFVTIIITLITICSRNKEELVAMDYYAQELKYQDKIDATNNEFALKESIDHQVNEKQIVLSVPLNWLSKGLNGEIFFYCPANSKKDVGIKMQFDSTGKQFILKTRLLKGTYKMRLSWISEKKNYYKENIITVN